MMIRSIRRFKSFMKKNDLICFFVLIISLLIIPSVSAQQKKMKRVLVVNSYHKGFPWTDNVVRGIESGLNLELNEIELFIEYMDTKSMVYGEEYKKILFDLYSYKFKDKIFDLIIVSDDNAFDFFREYHNELFPDVPVIVCGVNNKNAPDIVDPHLFTGILETSSHKETIDLILDLHKETGKIILIVDKTPEGQYLWNEIEPCLSDYQDIEFIRISEDYTIFETENILKGLSNDTAVIFFTLSRDKSGRYFSLKEGNTIVSKVSTRPVYSTHSQNLPYDVVGGKVIGGFHQGEAVADIVLRIFNGEEVSSISFLEESPTQYIFNYDQLKRWGINLSELPKNSIILNKPVSFYNKYMYLVWGVVGFILALFVIIFTLQIISIKRKQAEKKLIENQRLLSETEKLGKVGGWEFDTITRKQIWTKETYAIHELDDHLSLTVEDGLKFYIPLSIPVIELAIQRAIDYGESFDLELELITGKGNGRNVHVIGQADLNSHRVYGFFQDITDRKEVENELRETKEDFRAIAENTTDYIMRYDKDGRHLYGNSAALKAMGVTEEEYIGKTHRELGFPEYISVLWNKKIQDVFKTGKHQQFQIEVELNSVIKTLELSLDPEFRAEGDISTVLGISRDITKSKLVQEEKINLEKRLQQAQKMEAIGTLAGGIAHDFNNILGVIIGYTDLVVEESHLSPKSAKYLSKISDAADRAKQLVKQILTFSRQSQVERKAIRIQLLIKEGLKMLRASIPSTISIIEDIDPQSEAVLADPTQIHQILLNLCTNAYHAMDSTGGVLSVSLKNVCIAKEDQKMALKVNPGEYVELTVGDTGVGIAPENIGNIFDPYFTTKEVGKGTGMGLAIIHGIIKEYGGTIIVESREGEGSIFSVYFPVIPMEVSPVISSTVNNIIIGNERILLIDDEESLADMGKIMLERLGYDVTVRTDSTKALTIFENAPKEFDIVITDQTMPNITGSELAQRMMQIRPDIPIILCTGYSNLIDEVSAKALGIKGFVLKPLNKNILANLIRKVLDVG